jgi:hypothetical protein
MSVTVKGRLVGPKGNAIKGATVTFRSVHHKSRTGSQTPFGRSAQFWTSDDGAYEASIESGSYDITIDWGQGVKPFGSTVVTDDLTGFMDLVALVASPDVEIDVVQDLLMQAAAAVGEVTEIKDATELIQARTTTIKIDTEELKGQAQSSADAAALSASNAANSATSSYDALTQLSDEAERAEGHANAASASATSASASNQAAGQKVNYLQDLIEAGTPGPSGVDGNVTKIQYSPDGVADWVDVLRSSDHYLRVCTDTRNNGQFSCANAALFSPRWGVDYLDGANGNNVTVEYSQNGTDWHLGFNAGDTKIRTGVDSHGDGNFVYSEGSTFIPTKGVEYDDGAPGISSWLHTKYSTNGISQFTANGGEALGPYIGFAKTTSDENPDGADPEEFYDYEWSRVEGVPGTDGTDGTDGYRGPGFFRREVSGLSVWNDTEADAATGGINRPDDVVTLFKTEDPAISFTRRWNGASWVETAMYIDGDMVAEGSIVGNRLVAGTEIIGPLVRSAGKSDYNVGSGYYLGSDGKFGLGDGNKGLTWDGQALTLNGRAIVNSVVVGTGDYLAESFQMYHTSLVLINASGFPESGEVIVNGWTVSYSGKSGNTLTGIIAGSGKSPVGEPVFLDGSLLIREDSDSMSGSAAGLDGTAIVTKDWVLGRSIAEIGGNPSSFFYSKSVSGDYAGRVPGYRDPNSGRYPSRAVGHFQNKRDGWGLWVTSTTGSALYTQSSSEYASAAYLDGDTIVTGDLDVGGYVKSKVPSFIAEYSGDDYYAFTGATSTPLLQVDSDSEFFANNIFTAPVAGMYQFSVQVYAHEDYPPAGWALQIVTSDRTYTFIQDCTLNEARYQAVNISVPAHMDGNDTAKVNILRVGSSGSIKVRGSVDDSRTFFAGHMVSRD